MTRRLPLAIYLTTIGMEMCYLYLGLALMRQIFGLASLSFALILALYPLSFVFRVVTARLPDIARRGRLLTAIFGTAIVSAVTILAIRQILVADYPVAGAVIQIGFCGLSWWLGNTLVRGEISYPNISSRFQIGILTIIVLGAIEGRTFLPVVLFFTLAVFALALARWHNSLSSGRGVLRALSPWAIMLGGAAVLLPGIFIFFALSPNVAQVILKWLSTAWGGIVRLLEGVRLPPATESPVEFDFSCAFNPPEEVMPLPASPPPPADTPATTSPLLVWFVIFAVFLAVLFLVFLMIRRITAQRRTDAAVMVSVETTPIPVSLFGELAGLIRGIGKWLWHFWLSLFRLRRVARFRPLTEDEVLPSVRALYRSLLHWATRHGLPRVQSQTPLEYLELLRLRFPREERELALITDVYLQARYGRRPAGAKGFEAAQRAWQKVKSHSG